MRSTFSIIYLNLDRFTASKVSVATSGHISKEAMFSKRTEVLEALRQAVSHLECFR